MYKMGGVGVKWWLDWCKQWFTYIRVPLDCGKMDVRRIYYMCNMVVRLWSDCGQIVVRFGCRPEVEPAPSDWLNIAMDCDVLENGFPREIFSSGKFYERVGFPKDFFQR